MDKEEWKECLMEQYAEQVFEAYQECTDYDGRFVDQDKLNALLVRILNNAKVDGLSESEFEDIVHSTLSDVSFELEYNLDEAA